MCGALKTSIHVSGTDKWFLEHIVCISSVTKSFTTKRFTLLHPTDESKSLAVVGGIKLGCLVYSLLFECRSN